MSGQDHTLCDCCGGFSECKPHWLCKEQHHVFDEDFTDLFGSDDIEMDEQPPEHKPQKQEYWLCADCYDPRLTVTGVMPMCLHCYITLRPNEYGLQLCSRCHHTAAGVETRARYNHLRKKHNK